MPADLALPVLLGVLLGALLGASAHRAGLCTVKAVAEIMTTGQAHVLWSFRKASLWTLGLLAVASLAGEEPGLAARPLTLPGLGGGLLLGLGAGLNGASGFSTLARLAEGHAVMLLTLAGWATGLLVVRTVAPGLQAPAAASALPAWLVLPGLLGMLWEGRRLLARLRRRGRVVLAEADWPQSLGVALVALAGTGLPPAGHPWSFATTAICATGAVGVAACAQPVTLWAVSGAALLAMIASAVLRGSARLHPLRLRSAARRFGGGSLMGVGAGLVPGGNDGLILFGIPSLSPHALPAWLGIVAGIWLALAALRRAGLPVPRRKLRGRHLPDGAVTPLPARASSRRGRRWDGAPPCRNRRPAGSMPCSTASATGWRRG